jgi:hypothetical protein
VRVANARNRDPVPGGPKYLLASRLWLLGFALLFPAYGLWLAHNAIPALASTRSIATAAVSTWHDSNGVELQRAFLAAMRSAPAEATLAPQTHPSLPGVYQLAVTADTPQRAHAQLASVANALTAAFPSAERNLSVSLNNSTAPAPNDATRRISLAVMALMLLLMLGCQLSFVVGARLEGQRYAGLIAAVAAPFTILVFPTSSTTGAARRVAGTTVTADWTFVLLLLALTPIAILAGLWLTRRSHQ